MIVVDTNVISYFYLPSSFDVSVDQLQTTEPEWAAPILWKSEFRSVLTLYIRKQLLSLDYALKIMEEAESMMHDTGFEIASLRVLSLVTRSNCSSYDCEFVALAQQLNTKLITQDKKILQEFPDNALSIDDYLSSL